MIDVEEIIKDTIKAFEKSKNKLRSLPNVSLEEYKKLHNQPLVPLNIKIDTKLFEQEIGDWDHAFEQWGKNHQHLPRFGAALVNKDGSIHKNDPINGSLMEWNLAEPNSQLLETDCVIPTDILNLSSLKPLHIFNGHWCRSNIFKWYAGSKFLPHIDAVPPAPWIRLWGTTSSHNIKVRFYYKDGSAISPKIEAGRIYIIDTSIVHDAECNQGINYQFFLSVLPSAINILKENSNG